MSAAEGDELGSAFGSLELHAISKGMIWQSELQLLKGLDDRLHKPNTIFMIQSLGFVFCHPSFVRWIYGEER